MQIDTKVYLKQFFFTIGMAALVVFGYVIGVNDVNRQKIFDYYYEMCEKIGQKKIDMTSDLKQKILVS